MQLFSSKQNKDAGFTLVEMLVSISLFTVVLTMTTGTLLVLIDANGKAQNMQIIMSNFSFSLDSMTREIRTGTDWYCGQYTGNAEPNIPEDDVTLQSATADCAPGNYVSIMETGGSLTGIYGSERVTYYFDDDYYTGGVGAILRGLGKDGSDDPESGWVPLTGPEVDIDVFTLTVDGTSRYLHGSDVDQPTMTLYIRGTAGTDVQAKQFSLQTSVTQRQLDL